jgi:hypothetical protein
MNHNHCFRSTAQALRRKAGSNSFHGERGSQGDRPFYQWYSERGLSAGARELPRQTSSQGDGQLERFRTFMLLVVYWLLVTPAGLVLHVIHDPLRLHWDRTAPTYWDMQ